MHLLPDKHVSSIKKKYYLPRVKSRSDTLLERTLVQSYRAKTFHEKVDLLTKKIERTALVPIDRYGSRASKKVGVVLSIDQGAEKCESEGAENGPFPHTNEVACV